MKKTLTSLAFSALMITSLQGLAQSAQPSQSAQPPQSSVRPDAVIIYMEPDSGTGYSAKKSFLGKTVYNESKQKIGTITDLIIAPDTSVAYVVIGAGGFVGMGKHNVAVQTSALQVSDGKFVLPGATKESLKAAPKLQYPKKGA